MDIDSDVDAQLMQQFRSMGTQDKEVLISELQKVLGNQLNPSACAFFLDMNDWNLQAAVCSYYDFEQPVAGELPLMTLVQDVTIGEGESVRPNVLFVKTWRIKNSGTEVWPPGCSLKFIMGHQLCQRDRTMVDALAPGSECDVSITMTSPSTPGMYEGQWRMSSPTGALFGEDGLLDITQQMSRFGSELASPTSKVQGQENPFCSPENTVSSPVQTSPHQSATSPAAKSLFHPEDDEML